MKVSRIEWLREGLRFLCMHGEADLKIDRLAKLIGITRGSFYHHFVDRDDYLVHLANYWSITCNESVIIEGAHEDPRQALEDVVGIVIDRDLGQYETPMLMLGRLNRDVHKVVRKAMRNRFAFLVRTFEEAGAERFHARIFHTYMTAEYDNFNDMSKKQRKAQALRVLNLLLAAPHQPDAQPQSRRSR